MSIRVTCPECEAPCRIDEDKIGKKVRCSKCGESFRAEEPEEAIQDRPIRKESAAPKRSKLAPARNRTAPEPKSNALLLGLVLGGAGLLLLVVGGVLLYVFTRGKAATEQAVQVAQANVNQVQAAAPVNLAAPANPVAPDNAAPPNAGVPAANQVPDAPVGNGQEQFVDLPERGEGLKGIAGVNFGPAEPPPANPGANPPAVNPEMPAETAIATLANASAGRSVRPAGMVFKVDYSFPNGRPAGARFAWIIVPQTGLPFKATYGAAELRASGSLQCHRPGIVTGPYRCFLAVEKLIPGKAGIQEVRISDVLTFR